jgi:two-component system, NtrC family, sensor kinase
LASGIAHELGTPLNVVFGRAKMVATGEAVGPEAQESGRVIVDQVERMTKIIRQVLDFARRRTPDRGRHVLATIVDQMLNLLRPMAGKRNVQIAVEAENPAVHADVDPGQLQQALTNLVVNGLQAMPGGGELRIQLGRERAVPTAGVGGAIADYAVIAVADQGVGIAPEVVPRVFEPFFTTKDVGEGTGLGLSVAYGIARDHGGWIAVESVVGKGSRFALYLPVVRPAEVVA